MKSETDASYIVMLQSRMSVEEVRRSLSRFEEEVVVEQLFVEDGI
jgi:hypothetical protein